MAGDRSRCYEAVCRFVGFIHTLPWPTALGLFLAECHFLRASRSWFKPVSNLSRCLILQFQPFGESTDLPIKGRARDWKTLHLFYFWGTKKFQFLLFVINYEMPILVTLLGLRQEWHESCLVMFSIGLMDQCVLAFSITAAVGDFSSKCRGRHSPTFGI